jgi:hypothetical protein
MLGNGLKGNHWTHSLLTPLSGQPTHSPSFQNTFACHT